MDRSRTDGGHVRGYIVNTDEVLEYMRSHRQLALKTFLPVVAIVGVLVTLTAGWSRLGEMKVGSIPLLWLLLGPITLFSILLVTVLHERRALQLEERWMEQRQ